MADCIITGLVTCDQMIGPWQVPVADVAVTRSSYGLDVHSGEAMAMDERTPVGHLSTTRSARMTLTTNLAAARIGGKSWCVDPVKLSANSMCAASKAGEGAALSLDASAADERWRSDVVGVV